MDITSIDKNNIEQIFDKSFPWIPFKETYAGIPNSGFSSDVIIHGKAFKLTYIKKDIDMSNHLIMIQSYGLPYRYNVNVTDEDKHTWKDAMYDVLKRFV